MVFEVENLGGEAIRTFALRADGRLLVASRGDRVETWEVETARFRASKPVSGPVVQTTFSADGGSVRVDTEAGKTVKVDMPSDAPRLSAEVAAPGSRGIQEEGRIGLQGLSEGEQKRLAAWAKERKAKTYTQRGVFWVEGDSGGASYGLKPHVSPDGKLVVGIEGRENVYLRLDTGTTFRVGAWAHGLYQGKTVIADPEVRMGPSSDIVLAVSATFTSPRHPLFAGRLYDTRKGKLIADVTATCESNGAVFSKDGTALLVKRCLRNAHVVHATATGKALAHLDGEGPLMNATGTRVALKDDGGDIVVRAVPGGARLLTVPGKRTEEPSDIALRSDGAVLVRLEQASFTLLDLATLERKTLLDRTPDTDAIAWDAAERIVPVGTDDGLAIVDIESRSTLRVIPGIVPDGRLAVRPDGKAIAIAENEAKKVTVWPLPEGKPLEIAKAAHDDYVGALAWSSDGRLLAVAWQPSGHVDIYDPVAKRRLRRALTGADKLEGGEQIFVRTLAFLPGSHVLFAERAGIVPPSSGFVRVIARVNADDGKTLWQKEIEPFPKPALFKLAGDATALFTWEVDDSSGAETTGLGVLDAGSAERKRFLPVGPADSDFRRLHVPRLLADAARAPARIDALSWAVDKDDVHQAVTLSPGGKFAVRAGADTLSLVRSDGATLTIVDGTVGRAEVMLVLDSQGHFDASPASLPLIQAYRGPTPLPAEALAEWQKPGLLQEFLAGGK